MESMGLPLCQHFVIAVFGVFAYISSHARFANFHISLYAWRW